MNGAFVASLLALLGVGAPEKFRDFELGLLAPVGPGVEFAARSAGMTVRAAVPEGADSYSAGVPFTLADALTEERMADWPRLRLLIARAAVRGRTGVFFALPRAPAGHEPTDYPEEWQALARAARETAAMRPIVESGIEAGVPFAVPEGVLARAWRFQGRLYVLLVNDSPFDVPLSEDSLMPWRALFEVRADARDLLGACGGGRCLGAERVLWLEGRL